MDASNNCRKHAEVAKFLLSSGANISACAGNPALTPFGVAQERKVSLPRINGSVNKEEIKEVYKILKNAEKAKDAHEKVDRKAQNAHERINNAKDNEKCIMM